MVSGPVRLPLCRCETHDPGMEIPAAKPWPSTIAESDAVIVRDDTPDGVRFVIGSRRQPQVACATYAEAEARVLAYAVQSQARAWYLDARGEFHLLGKGARPSSRPSIRVQPRLARSATIT